VSTADGDIVGETLRREDPDRYFADLFAPAGHRPHLFALHAFNAEVSAIRHRVREPMPGEIRLQWWRDTIEAGNGQGHPVADALVRTIEARRLPRAAFDRLLEGRRADIYDDQMPDMAAFEAYAGETVSAVFQLGALILADGADPGSADAAGHAGVAYGLTAALRELPITSRQGRLMLPRDILFADGGSAAELLDGAFTGPMMQGLARLRAEARRHLQLATAAVNRLAPPVRVAFLPLALVEPYLRRMDRRDYQPLGRPVELPLWRRQWALWRASRG
jgi:phytoene synthase